LRNVPSVRICDSKSSFWLFSKQEDGDEDQRAREDTKTDQIFVCIKKDGKKNRSEKEKPATHLRSFPGNNQKCEKNKARQEVNEEFKDELEKRNAFLECIKCKETKKCNIENGKKSGEPESKFFHNGFLFYKITEIFPSRQVGML